MNIKWKKEVLKMFSYGVYILTSKYKDRYCASTITWVSQSSFDPPLVISCIRNDSETYQIVKKKGYFLLHVLAEKQKNIAASFFKTAIVKDSFINNHKYRIEYSLPVIEDAPAFLYCKVRNIIEDGDHHIFLGEVKEVELKDKVKPLDLKLTGWSYGG